MRWLILLICFAAPALATETEVILEEGNAEIELSNGIFVALSAGADVRILHRDDGAPEMIEIRRGSVQVISTFGDPRGMSLRIGGSVMTLGRGGAIFSVTPQGGVEMISMNGSPIKQTRDQEGAKPDDRRKDGKSGGKGDGRETSFGKKPKKRNSDSGEPSSNTRSVGEDAGLNGPLKPKKAEPNPKAGPKMQRPKIKAQPKAKSPPPPPPPQAPDTATREMSDRAKTIIEEQQPAPQPEPPGPQPTPPPPQPSGPNPPGPQPPGPKPPGPNPPGPQPPGPNPPGPNPPGPPQPPREPGN